MLKTAESLNMDFSQRVVIDTAAISWVDSPSGGVQRKPLERQAAESGHATSVVRYLPGASFSRHGHPGGEEILVLEGVFSDESGDYGPGTYFRNPPGSSHAPFSRKGCVLLVKLCQFQQGDLEQICIDTRHAEWLPGQGGLQVMPLHQYLDEHIALVKWPANEVFKPHNHPGGEEIFVISGTFCDQHAEYPAGTWLRNPHLSNHHPYVACETIIWVKTGHLFPLIPAAR
ncbi:MAG: cupin [Gammaproteobacteria bacterium]|nr:cupin [Gammaproteobacteria bacterium]